MLRWFKNKNKKNISAPFTNEEWVKLLGSPPNEQAVDELRKILVRGLKPALAKYVDRELHQFVEDTAQDGLLKILDNVNSFRGESKFTTWAMKITVREGLTVLRRKKWNDISLNDLRGPNAESDSSEIFSEKFASGDASPEQMAAQNMMVEKVQGIIQNVLTEKQRTAITAIMMHGLPITVVAEKMGTNRNNIYKLVYDARKKIKSEFVMEGIDPEEMLNDLSKK
jgi:RNA polymerase sigma-70 factor (ECF subfamily)